MSDDRLRASAPFALPPAPVVVALGDVPWQRWRNGRGRTRELLAWPAGDAWRVRVSVAEIVDAAPFSAFDGVERWFTVVDGAGVTLRLDGIEHALRPGSPPLRFDGGASVDAVPLDGPTRDLNLMVRGGTGTMQVVQPDAWWAPSPAADATQVGLYAAAPLRWVAELGSRRTVVSLDGRLPAHALLWFEQAPRRLRILPMAPASGAAVPGPAGWWLAASVRTPGAGAHDAG